MKLWVPPPIWKNGTVYIIGGGPSINGIDWKPFKNKRVIGCNDAYKLGDWIDICWFGDYYWYWGQEGKYPGHRENLLRFPGLKMTLAEKPIEDPGIIQLPRVSIKKGLIVDRKTGRICWNGNTGISAINLALYLGCIRIILVGFDMKRNGNEETNWHINLKSPNLPKNIYERYMGSAFFVKKDLDKHFPQVEVLNANPDSAMTVFPRVKLEEVI